MTRSVPNYIPGGLRRDVAATTATACIFGPLAMATVYAVANQKGGVGKTTTAVNLAACVAEAGCRTLLVDLDPQCNATVALGLPKDHEPNTYTCLLDGSAIADAAVPSSIDLLRVVTSTPDLAGATVELPRLDSSEQRLRDAAPAGRGQLRAHRPRLPALARARSRSTHSSPRTACSSPCRPSTSHSRASPSSSTPSG